MPAGQAVSTACYVSGLSVPNHVSNIVREPATGNGFLFSDRGETELRGFEDPVRLFEVRW